jgi:hypothetical protein
MVDMIGKVFEISSFPIISINPFQKKSKKKRNEWNPFIVNNNPLLPKNSDILRKDGVGSNRFLLQLSHLKCEPVSLNKLFPA